MNLNVVTHFYRPPRPRPAMLDHPRAGDYTDGFMNEHVSIATALLPSLALLLPVVSG